MGLYLNPPDMSKEKWLDTHAKRVNGAPTHYKRDGFTAACWVHNGQFATAGLCFSQAELEAFRNDGANRIKVWYWVPDDMVGAFQ